MAGTFSLSEPTIDPLRSKEALGGGGGGATGGGIRMSEHTGALLVVLVALIACVDVDVREPQIDSWQTA